MEKDTKKEISIDDFSKIDIRIGKVLSAEILPDSDKLIIFKIDIGEDIPRQILSGIRKYYPDPEVLIGKLLPVLCNLAPRTIRGHESNGMILYAYGKEEHDEIEKDFLFTVEPSNQVPPGTIVC